MNTFKQILDHLRVERKINIDKLIKRMESNPRSFYKWINLPLCEVLKNEHLCDRFEVIFHASVQSVLEKYQNVQLPTEDLSVHRASLVLKRERLPVGSFLRALYEYLIDNGHTFKSMAKKANMPYWVLSNVTSGRIILTADKLARFESMDDRFKGFTAYQHIAAKPDLDAVFQSVTKEIPRYKEKSGDLELKLQSMYKNDQVTMVFHLLHILKDHGKLSEYLNNWFSMWALPD